MTDGYHSFKELYDYRMVYNAAFFNELAKQTEEDYNFNNPELITDIKIKYNVHKSLRHEDNEPCFGGGWFIVVAVLPTGTITNHYPMKYWDLFKIPVLYKSNVVYDGHTPEDALNRLIEFLEIPESNLYEICDTIYTNIEI